MRMRVSLGSLWIAGVVLVLAGCPGEADIADWGVGPADSQAQGQDAPALRDGPAADVRHGDRGAADSRQVDRGKPDAAKYWLQGVTLLVNLGDSLAAGYSASSGNSYKALLVQNNNVAYATYKGRDLTTRCPGLRVVDKSKSGAQTKDVVQQALSVSGNPSGVTLVVISAGGNDFNDNLLTMVNPIQTAAVAQAATTNLGRIASHFADRTRFPGGVVGVMLNVHDPTDGTGVLPAISGLSGFCSTIMKVGALLGPIAVANLGSFNGHLATFATKNGVLAVDNHAACLGHGFHYNVPKSKHYRVSDPTLWFHTDCAHLNNRGHHELRRLIWQRLTGEL